MIYALTATGLFTSSTNGSTWEDKTSSIPTGVVINTIAVYDGSGLIAVAMCKNNTVMSTVDGGTTWFVITTGTFRTLSSTEEWVTGQVTAYAGSGIPVEAIIATASGRVAKVALDQVNLVGIVGEDVSAIYFDGDYGVAGGYSGKIHVTFDAGGTWLGANGGLALYGQNYPGKVVGLYCDFLSGFIVVAAQNGVWRSSDGGVSFSHNFLGSFTSFAFDKRLPMSMWLAGDRGLLVRSENNGVSWSVVRGNLLMESAIPVSAISTNNGETLLFAEGRVLSQWRNGVEESLLDTDPVHHLISAPDPNIPVCYTLTDCDGMRSPFYTDEDLDQYVGQVVTFLEVTGPGPTTVDHPGCWRVTKSLFNCTGSQGYLADVIILTSHVDCHACKKDPCYLLTNCDGLAGGSFIAGNTLLADFVDQVIRICSVELGVTTCNCYTVTIEVRGCSFSNDIDFDGVSLYYEPTPRVDCECCADDPVPPTPEPYVQVRYLNPKDFSTTDMSACEISATTSFANLMERKMMFMRLGLKSVEPPVDQMAIAGIRFKLMEFSRMPTSGLCIDKTACGCCQKD